MARNTIGKLSVLLTANTTPFGRGMRKAGQTLKAVSRAATVTSTAIAGVGIAAGAGLAALTKQQLAATDSLAKNADRLGISTEALAGLQHASELAGVSGEKMNTSLQRMNKRLGEAAQGGGPAADALERLGLNVDNLVSMPADQSLGVIADALNTVENQAEKSAIAFDLFGRDGIELFTLFKGGSKGLQDAATEAERLGLAVSRVDAAKIEAANDAWTRTKRLATGLGRQVAVAVAPAIEMISTKLFEVGTTGDGVAGKVQGAIRGGINGLAVAADGIDALRESGLSLKALVLDLLATTIEGLDKVGSKAKTIGVAALSAINPQLGGLAGGLATASSAGLSSAARAAADEAARTARLGLTGADSYGNRIRQFGQNLLDGAPPPLPPASEENQDETNKKLDQLTSVVRDTHDIIRDKLGELSDGSINAQFLQTLDRLAVTLPEALRSGAGGAGPSNGLLGGFDLSGGSLA